MERIRREIRESKGFNSDLKYRIMIAMEDAENILAKKRSDDKKGKGKSANGTPREEEVDSNMDDDEFENQIRKLTAERKGREREEPSCIAAIAMKREGQPRERPSLAQKSQGQTE
jgi:hypothetical protein